MNIFEKFRFLVWQAHGTVPYPEETADYRVVTLIYDAQGLSKRQREKLEDRIFDLKCKLWQRKCRLVFGGARPVEADDEWEFFMEEVSIVDEPNGLWEVVHVNNGWAMLNEIGAEEPHCRAVRLDDLIKLEEPSSDGIVGDASEV